MNGFQRGLDPKSLLCGITFEVHEWFKKNNLSEAEFDVRLKGKTIIVKVKGCLVLVDLEIDRIVKDKGFTGIKLKITEGFIYIFDHPDNFTDYSLTRHI